MFDYDNVDTNNKRTLELYDRIAMTGDDRSKVILAAIIVEYYFDRILKLILVGLKNPPPLAVVMCCWLCLLKVFLFSKEALALCVKALCVLALNPPS